MIHISKTLSSQVKLIPSCATQLIDALQGLSFTPEDLFKIKLSFEEALANAIVHGNHSQPDLSVEIALRIKEDSIEIDIVNQGEGFDFGKLPDPTRVENREKLSGRGLFLIKNNMDQVFFFDQGRGITMIKVFAQKGAGCGH